jgi:hypothetical protein
MRSSQRTLTLLFARAITLDWPIRELAVGELPRPSECLRSTDGLGTFVGLTACHPTTHTAALIGPKP